MTVTGPEGGRIEVVRGAVDETLADELVAFWTGEGALREPAARQRIAQVVCVLRDGEGRIAGVNSVYGDQLELVGGRRFWVYRSFLRSDSRSHWAAMAETAFEALNERFAATGEGPGGLCVPVTDRAELARRPEAVWPDAGFLYAGHLPNGAQARIAYFDGALIGPGRNALMGDDTLEAGYRIEVFADQEQVSGEDVIELWQRESAVAPEEARRRVLEVLLVALHEEDGLVGVASAYLQRNPQLDMQLWYYRAFVAAAHRHGNVAVQLALQGRDLLEGRYVSGADDRGAGIVYEVENVGLQQYFNQALWRPTLLTFIGENAAGAHVRVRYFPGARAPDAPAATPPSA